MKIFILGVFAAIALWFRSVFSAEDEIGFKSLITRSEDSPSMFSDDVHQLPLMKTVQHGECGISLRFITA